MRQFALVAALLLASACSGVRPTPIVTPPKPELTWLVAHVFDGDPAKDKKVPGAAVRIEGCESPLCNGVADEAGNVTLTVPRGSYRVCAAIPGKDEVCADAVAAGEVNLAFPVVTPTRPEATQLRVDGRFWVNSQGTFRPQFASDLYALSMTDWEAKLDETVRLGFNGVRVFAGHLGQVGQTPEMARERLPLFLQAAADRGLYVYVCALTGGGYDVQEHLRMVSLTVARFPNAVLEVANEIGHPSQSDLGKDPARLLDVAKRLIPAGVVWTLGAPVQTDEPAPDGTWLTDGGQFNDAHLDRGRDPWNQVRRLREIYAIAENTKKPAMSGEPIGSDERTGGSTGTKQRLHDPGFFFTMGVLCRGFELGCVFHSEDGLNGRVLGPNQTVDAEAFIAGTKAIPTEDRLNFQNAGWATSPVEAGNFDNGIVRIYSFMAGNRGWTVLLGITGDPRLKLREGWRVVGVVAERPGVQVLEISR